MTDDDERFSFNVIYLFLERFSVTSHYTSHHHQSCSFHHYLILQVNLKYCGSTKMSYIHNEKIC